MSFPTMSRALVFAALAASLCAHADDTPVPAMNEPFHHNKFENDVVRILDVEVDPGGQTKLHTHSVDYPYLMISDATLKNEVLGKAPKDLPIKAGLIGYYRASEGAYTHRFINAGTTPFRAIGIELVGARVSADESPALSESAGFKKELDNERVRAYRISLAPGASAGPATLTRPSVLVSMGTGQLERIVGDHATERVELTPAKFDWQPGPTTWLLRNPGDKPIELVWFEIK